MSDDAVNIEAAADAALAALLSAALAEATARVVAHIRETQAPGWVWEDVEADAYPPGAALCVALASLDEDALNAVIETATHVYNDEIAPAASTGMH